jgi:SAM-dependent methyltransferase
MSFDKKYAKYYDLFNRGKEYSKECDFIEQVFKNSAIQIKEILDLGCGTGLHDKELSNRGYNITGMDLSKEMIDIAQTNNKNIEFIVGDMTNFNLNKKFDSIICMFSSIGYLTENNQIEDFFSCVKNHLNEKGTLIIDCWNGLGVMREVPSEREKIVETEGLKIVRKSFPYLDSKNHIVDIRFNVKVFEKDNLIDDYQEKHKVRFFFPKELEKYMNDQKLKVVHLCPAYNFYENVDEKKWNMILVGN